MFQHTRHSEWRSALRGLSADEIEYVCEYGSCFHRGGALIYFLREKDLPADDRRREWARHLVGAALVFAPDDLTLLTAWRNRRSGLKAIRKKPAYKVEEKRA